MKIKTQITLSFIVIILIITSTFMYLSSKTFEAFSKLNIDGTKTIIESVTKDNIKNSKDILAAYGKKMLKSDINSMAQELSVAFCEMKKPLDIEEARSNQKLKSIASRSIYTLSENVGKFYIVNKKGDCVLLEKDNDDARRFEEIKRSYPLFSTIIEESFKQNNSVSDWDLVKPSDKASKLYVIMRQIPGAGLNLCAIVNLDKFFQEINKSIEDGGKSAETSSEKLMRTILVQMKQHYEKESFVYAVLILVFGVAYGLWFGNFICRPIKKLQDAIRELKEGRIPQQLKEEGTSETIMITKSFNDMTSVFRKEDIQNALKKARGVQNNNH